MEFWRNTIKVLLAKKFYQALSEKEAHPSSIVIDNVLDNDVNTVCPSR